MQKEDIENWFTYHSPTSEQQVAYNMVRAHAKDLAFVIFDVVPDSADRTAAMRKLREAVMTANAAIACAPVYPLFTGEILSPDSVKVYDEIKGKKNG